MESSVLFSWQPLGVERRELSNGAINNKLNVKIKPASVGMFQLLCSHMKLVVKDIRRPGIQCSQLLPVLITIHF